MSDKTSESLKSAEASKDLTSAMETSLGQIFDGIKDMTMQIATSTEEQHQAAEHINQNIISVKNSSTDTETIASDTRELSDDLQVVSKDLSHLVSKFKM